MKLLLVIDFHNLIPLECLHSISNLLTIKCAYLHIFICILSLVTLSLLPALVTHTVRMNDPLLEPSNDLNNLPKPGEVIIYDFNEVRRNICEEFKVKAVQWNIERAYKLDEIIELLSKESTGFKDQNSSYKTKNIIRKQRFGVADIPFRDFDLMAIQEFDINCARSNYRNSPLELARALKMKCAFLCEFEEIYSEKLRNKRSQGGGVHGNGILTWWDIEKVEVIDHVEIFNWERDGEKLNEPRRGSRSLACFLRHPLDASKRVLVYSVHLEVFCGIFGRLRQFSQILEHSRANLVTYPHQMILGDLNTMAHGLARFFPKYCCDAMRWRSVGWSEAEWWQRNLFSVTLDLVGKEGINCYLAAHHHPKKPKEELESVQIEQEIEHEIEEEERSTANSDDLNGDDVGSSNDNSSNNISTCIFTPAELKNLINPHFFCPFPASRFKTLEMHGYSGKLDWMLLRGWRVLANGLDNEGYRRSDHKLLWTEVVAFKTEDETDNVVGSSEDLDKAVDAHDFYFKSINKPSKVHAINSLSIFPDKKVFISAGVIGFTGILFYYLLKRNE